MKNITRRVFLSQSCRKASCLLITALAGTMLGGCGIGSNMEEVSASVVDGAITLSIDTVSPLATVGRAVFVESPAGALVVAHVSSGVFTALSGICTHEICKISRYEADTRQFLCPCHSAYFNTDGQPVWGPARRPLTSYETRVEGDRLIIRLS